MEKGKIYSQLLKISKEVGIPVKKILDVLFVLKDGEAVENNELIRRVGISKNVINQVKEMLGSLLQPVSSNTRVKRESLEQINTTLGDNYIPEENLLYFECNKTSGSLLERRVIPLREYDQFTATAETVFKRAGLLNFFCDIRGKKILFLGDNDFTSIAVATLGLANKITVLDVDKRILDTIQNISKEKDFGIKTIRHDLRNPLPQEVANSFDIVFTDPPYTDRGVKLFLSRAVGALDLSGNAARIYICYGNSDRAKERFLPIYEIFTASGLMIRWVFDKFNRYQGAESIGSSSSLFILDVTPKTKSLILEKYDKPIYTNN